MAPKTRCVSGRSIALVTVAALALGLPRATSAQERRASPWSFELDALGGYTMVNIERWSRFRRVDARSQDLAGGLGRVFVVYLGQLRVGAEAGFQHLFWYQIEGQSPGLIVRRRVNVAPQYGGVVFRLVERSRLDVDYGFGFHFFGETSRPGTHFSATFRLVKWRGFSLPIGARFATILDEEAMMVPIALKAGVSFRR